MRSAATPSERRLVRYPCSRCGNTADGEWQHDSPYLDDVLLCIECADLELERLFAVDLAPALLALLPSLDDDPFGSSRL
jgi:hypothetical protein